MKETLAMDVNEMYKRTHVPFRKCDDLKRGRWFDLAIFKVSPRVPYDRNYCV